MSDIEVEQTAAVVLQLLVNYKNNMHEMLHLLQKPKRTFQEMLNERQYKLSDGGKGNGNVSDSDTDDIDQILRSLKEET
jgi:hypothetical protein